MSARPRRHHHRHLVHAITPAIQPLERRTLFAVVLDAGFGDNGQIAAALGDNGGFANNIAFMQSLADGKILLGGSVGFEGDVRIARYTAAGQLDTTFNGDGFSDDARLPIPGYTASGVVAPDGKIVVGCFFDDRQMIVRFTAGGDIDTTFGGGDGIAEIADYGSAVEFKIGGAQVAVADDGRIVVAGAEQPGNTMLLARLTASGALDTSFSGDGKTTFDVSDIVSGPDFMGLTPMTVAVLDDDKILIFAQAHQTPAVLRLAPNGTLDPSFGGGDGIAIVAFGDSPTGNTASDMALTEDGKIIVGGVIGTHNDDNVDNLPAIARLTADGAIDTSFGNNGIALAGSDGDGIAHLAVDAQGRIVGLGGRVFRWTDTGQSDAAFGTNGASDLPVNNGGQQSLALGANDRILYTFSDVVAAVNAQPRPALQLAPNGTLIVTELQGDNTITIADAGNDDLVVTVNGVVSHFSVAALKALNILTGDGDDTINAAPLDLSDISEINLGGGANTLTVGDGDAHITTGDGDDSLTAGDGTHTIDSNDGDDSITTGDGPDTIFGELGDDSIAAGGGDDSVFGAEGSDTLDGGAGDDWLTGGVGFFSGDSAAGQNVIHGGDGDDVCFGADNRDTIYGGAGKDLMVGYAGSDKLVGGGGKDKIAGNGGRDRIYGGAGNDKLDGGTGDDRVFGGAGGDGIIGGRGSDLLDGDAGDDFFSAMDDTIDTVDGGSGTNVALSFDQDDELLNITNQ